jgi:hypothetical protein
MYVTLPNQTRRNPSIVSSVEWKFDSKRKIPPFIYTFMLIGVKVFHF